MEHKVYIRNAYCHDADVTIILKEIYTAEGHKPTEVELLGFYKGRPDEDKAIMNIGNLKLDYSKENA